jgi:CPA2 family monovalent cation:H+ antiporter-2
MPQECRMVHNTPLISPIVVGLVLAFVFGALAHRLRVSVIWLPAS